MPWIIRLSEIVDDRGNDPGKCYAYSVAENHVRIGTNIDFAKTYKYKKTAENKADLLKGLPTEETIDSIKIEVVEVDFDND
jgi:hypothetical protein